MKNALAAVTFAMVLLAATIGLSNWATSTVKAAGPAGVQVATATVGFNGLGDPQPTGPRSNSMNFNGLGDPQPTGPRSNSMNFNGLGDPQPTGPRSNSMSF